MPLNQDLFVFCTGVNLGEITQQNVDEFLFRLQFLERVGKPLTKKPITRAAIEQLVGSSTDAPTRTRQEWFQIVCREIARDIERGPQMT